jgi:uncharacterized protein YidB (DUF937 family)
MESFLKNPFQNPFGGAMNPSGGGGGVLEQIQEQVNTNGETLQSLQGGIGGLQQMMQQQTAGQQNIGSWSSWCALVPIKAGQQRPYARCFYLCGQPLGAWNA